jgi:outer membrane receptor protein involved in Fe transport
MAHCRILVLALALVALNGADSLAAQADNLKGVVRDATGAAVPGVTITATNTATKDTRTTTTTQGGSYSMAVPIGGYVVTATLPGFRAETQTVDVSADGARVVDFTLEATLSEQVTVTAMKRETTVLETPFSVAAPTEETLRARGVEGIEGVAANVGGFTVQNLGPGQSQVAMRGVSAGQIVRDQPGVKEQVGVYLDESVISMSLFTPDVDLFDTSRVEVLRGPQGTLFGSGSLSGTVRYITNQPELGVVDGAVELGGSGVAGGSFGGNTKVAVNVPLGERAALRVAAFYNHIAGFVDAVRPGGAVEEDVNDGSRCERRQPHRCARRRPLCADRAHVDHAARLLSEGGDRWMESRRCVQHPRQPVHNDARPRSARRSRAVHAVGGGVHRRLSARRRERHT